MQRIALGEGRSNRALGSGSGDGAPVAERVPVPRRGVHRARQGEVFQCPENRTSKRGPEISLRLAQAQERWRGKTVWSDIIDPFGLLKPSNPSPGTSYQP